MLLESNIFLQRVALLLLLSALLIKWSTIRILERSYVSSDALDQRRDWPKFNVVASLEHADQAPLAELVCYLL